MNKAEFVFTAIDVLGKKPQNAVTFPGIVSIKDIRYSNKGENKDTCGDLYYKPEILNDEKKHPIIVYIRGGGFIKGDKGFRVSISEYYANEGYFVFTVNQRLPPKYPFPDSISDCADALNFLEELSLKYPFDLDNIVVTGDSSGAYIASYLSALKFNDGLSQALGCPEIKVNIKAAMYMCGIYDIEVLVKNSSLFGVIPQTARLLTGFDFKKDFSNLKDYKYSEYLSTSNFVNEKWCPSFVFWADDDIICIEQGEPLSKKLINAGVMTETYHRKGLIHNHCFHLNFTLDKYAGECMGESVKFLKKVCK